MSNSITVNFTPCSTPPSNGYNVIYRPSGSSIPFRNGGNFTSSPVQILDTNDPDGTEYEGYIRADIGTQLCTNVFFKTGDNVFNADLTFSYVKQFSNFSASLNTSIDADVQITMMFADGFADSPCLSGSAVASAQWNGVGSPLIITAGGTGVSHDAESTSGDWNAANFYGVYNVIVNGSPVNDGTVMVIGGYNVTIHIPSCNAV